MNCSTALIDVVSITPLNATTVRLTWSGNYGFPTTLQYTSYYNVTGSVMSQYEEDFPPEVSSTDITLNDHKTGYDHVFTLTNKITEDRVVATTLSFAFGMFILSTHL